MCNDFIFVLVAQREGQLESSNKIIFGEKVSMLTSFINLLTSAYDWSELLLSLGTEECIPGDEDFHLSYFSRGNGKTAIVKTICRDTSLLPFFCLFCKTKTLKRELQQGCTISNYNFLSFTFSSG